MYTLVELIKEHIPSIGPKVAYIVFVVFLVLNISDDFDKIISFIKRLLNFQRHVDKLYYVKKRNKYNRELCTPEFIKWQMELLEKIYNPIIEMKRNQGWEINFTELDIDGIKQKYEGITLKMKSVEFPFYGVCDKQFLETKEQQIKLCKALGEKDFYDSLIYIYSKEQKSFTEKLLVKNIGITETRAKEIIASLQEFNLLFTNEVELNDEIIKVYSLYENVAVIGLLANLDMIVNRPQNFYCYLGNKHDKFF